MKPKQRLQSTNKIAFPPITELSRLAHHTLNQITDIIIWSKPNGKLVYFNDAVLTQLGYTREEFLSINSSDFIIDYDAQSKELFRKTLTRYKVFKGECVLRKKNGEKIISEIISNLVFLNNQLFHCTIFRDITKRKNREINMASLVVENADLKRKLEAENFYLKNEIQYEYNYGELVSAGKNYKPVLTKIKKVAPTDSLVLIFGEVGTGKQLIARTIHQNSKRKNNSLIKINCSSLIENSAEKDLFGYDNTPDIKFGRIELANGGTLLLNEIGDLPHNLQSKFIQILEDSEFYRLGGRQAIKVDLRIIATTKYSLNQLVNEGKVKEELFYKLNIYPIHNIPLKQRKEDIPYLVRHFVKFFNNRLNKTVSKISEKVEKIFLDYDYPGNVQELKSIIERAVIASNGKSLNPKGLYFISKNRFKPKNGFVSLEEMTRQYFLKVLSATNWKISGGGSSSEILQLNPKTLVSKLRKLGIKREDHLIHNNLI